MALIVNNISLSIEEDKSLLKEKISKKLKISESSIKKIKILRESIDARKKNDIKFNYSLSVSCENELTVHNKLKNTGIQFEKEILDEEIRPGTKKMTYRPVVVGMGPAGMFAALTLAKQGYKPLVIERGECVEERSKSVENFWKTGILNTDSNVQFGEGGAGTFSDGKLTTRIKDRRCSFILEEFVKAGAPEEIIYSGKPHIGTDVLKEVVKNIRKNIIKLGGEVRFNSKLEDIVIKNGQIKNIVVNGAEIPCESLILAIGHSSRDTYEMLYKKSIFMESKPFAIGARVEHLKEMIDINQYGKYHNHPRLKAADYRLTHNTKEGRGVYSFCMCPGGVVVAAASEDKRLVTNGMSYYSRNEKNSNSAIVVSVRPEDFEGNSPLSGIEFQRHYEKLAYELGGGNYKAPVQLVQDFLNDKVTTKLNKIEPSYKPGYEFKNLSKCLPKYVVESMKEGLYNFESKIKGFAGENAILTGIETRTSAPVRICRNNNLESVSAEGLYPSGEGAGYAGGIVSAAVDGVKVAEKIIVKYSTID